MFHHQNYVVVVQKCVNAAAAAADKPHYGFESLSGAGSDSMGVLPGALRTGAFFAKPAARRRIYP
jgi:hypothetical protein